MVRLGFWMFLFSFLLLAALSLLVPRTADAYSNDEKLVQAVEKLADELKELRLCQCK